MISASKINGALYEALKKIDKGSEIFNQMTFPAAASVNSIYPHVPNGSAPRNQWTQGFWTGLLWLAYEATTLEKFKKSAQSHFFTYRDRVQNHEGLDHHDMGFLFLPSMGAEYSLSGRVEAKELTIKAADLLIKRYQERGEFIQAWGELGAQESYRLIIDCNMNVPLLMWAYKETKNPQYKEIAEKHWSTALKVVLREDGSTHHTFFFDNKTGAPLGGKTYQGHKDDSAWARGQGWGVYGFSLAYRYTREEKYLTKVKEIIKYYEDHLPEDLIPYWDLTFTKEDKEERDSSAAAIVVCGLQELLKVLPKKDKDYAHYTELLEKSLEALIDNYTTRDNPLTTGLLKESVYAKNPSGNGVNECTMWGDYYYMEALVNTIIPERRSFW